MPTYDANGNATNRNGYGITWSSYNYPISINGLNKNITLYYGPSRQYYEQIYTDGSTTEKTIYAGGLLEKVTLGSLVDWRHYIRVGNELVAIMSRQSSGTNVTHYTLSDHGGSLAQITDGSAATTVTESVSAFGTRRNPTTWSGVPTCPDLCTIKSISREGYTGHDAMGGVSMGLNHMIGRLQDAITGRFLSPDPTVSDPTNTQSYNRYAYVNNNPLSYTDPTGFEGVSIIPVNPCDSPNACLPPIEVDCTVNCGPDIPTPPPPTLLPPGAIQLGPVPTLGDIAPAEPISTPAQTPPSKAPPDKAPPGKAPPAQSPKQTQCMNSDGSIGNDSPGTLSNPNVVYAGFDLEGYLLSGGGAHVGGFYDRSTGNFGAFFSVDLGGGYGGSGGFSVGVASNLSSFQGPTGVVGGGLGPVAATYTFQSGDPTSPVSVSFGPAYNLMPVLNAPASFHVGKSFTKIGPSTLKPCP